MKGDNQTAWGDRKAMKDVQEMTGRDNFKVNNL